MSRNGHDTAGRLAGMLLARVDPRLRVWLVIGLVMAGATIAACRQAGPAGPAATGPSATAGTDGDAASKRGDAAGGQRVTVAFWNVENLFDDVDDPTNHDDHEDWFARDGAALRMKADHLARVVTAMNDGRGPDLLATAEVESLRALTLLRDTVNARLAAAGRGADRYDGVAFLPDRTGRRFAPGVLTRLPLRAGATRRFTDNGNTRVLEVVVEVRGAPLTVLTGHWTSRLRGGNADRRMSYALDMRRRVGELSAADPAADVLVCGDFNDTPGDESVRTGLGAVPGTDWAAVATSGDAAGAVLLNLTGALDPAREGTLVYGSGRFVFDHLCVSRGLADGRGWTMVPGTTRTFQPDWLVEGSLRRPFRFGGPEAKGPRGFADHLPVMTELRVR